MSSANLLSSFNAFVEKNCRVSKQNNFLLTVSGGIDSIVMAHLFSQSNYSFSIAHCNFNLRGEESNGDENLVNQLAEKYKVKFFVKHFDTLKVLEAENISIQMAARNLRFAWFEKLRIENNFDFIATAHHQHDVTETVLLNIIRGTGLEGLKGILARNNFIIRPLLFANREELLEYANENNLQWREDSSNASTDYQRNFIRHKIIPLLKEINPSVHDSIRNLSSYANQSLLLAKETIEKYRAEYCTPSNNDLIIDTEKIAQHPAKATLLFYLLKDFNFNASQIESMISSNEKSGVAFYSPTHRLIINRKQFIVSSIAKGNDVVSCGINESDVEVHLNNGTIQLQMMDKLNSSQLKNSNSSTAFIDTSKIKFPLLLRKWQKGDYFYPLGMEHRKKLSDYFTDEKFSLADKENTWLLTCNNEIVWIVNHRLDNRYRITDATTTVLQIEFKP